jgi:CO/xanthine dehydrogenase FAD-binding subunit
MKLPLPTLPDFTYIRAESAAQASELLWRESDSARLLMGGTDLLIRMRNGELQPGFLIDVKNLPGMRDITHDARQGLRVGAAVTMNQLARHPAVQQHFALLVEAASSVASYQLRNRATIGGNLCNASPAADMAPPTLVLGASLVAHGPHGERAITADDFFLGPGETCLQKGELLTHIIFPAPPDGTKARYCKLGRNAQGDLAIVGVAALGHPDQGAPSGYRFRIALASVAPTPIRVPQAEELLASAPIDAEAIAGAASHAAQAARPIDDPRASASYRRAMVEVFVRRAVSEVWAMLQKEG